MTEKPEILIKISQLIDQLAEDLPVGTAWVFAAIAQVPDDRLATMFCTNQDDDSTALALVNEALLARLHPDSVAESHKRRTVQ